MFYDFYQKRDYFFFYDRLNKALTQYSYIYDKLYSLYEYLHV